MTKGVFLVFFLTLTSLIGSLYSRPQDHVVSETTTTHKFPNKDSSLKALNESAQTSKPIISEQFEESTLSNLDLLPSAQPNSVSNNTAIPMTGTSIKNILPPKTTTKSNTTEPTTALAPTTTNGSTTNTPPTSSTTQKPSDKPCKKFDGPSFVGGVVLTMGMLAIAFVAYKFYKARNERNYHTL